MRRWTVIPSLLAALCLAGQAHAACPQELSVYSEVGGATELNFRPETEAAIVANSFRLILPDGPVLEGHVTWNEGVSRPTGALMLDCPEGDLTGDEIAACTHWQGVVYALDAEGNVGLIPPRGETAAPRLLLADLSRALHAGPLNDGKTALPAWDVYALSGCQE